MGIIVSLLIAVLFAVIVFWLIDRIGLDARTSQIVKAILAIIFLIYLLQEFVHPWGGPFFR